MSEHGPVACRLPDIEQREREATIRRFLGGVAEGVSEREDGIEISFSADAACLGPIAELIALERSCCPFLRFELEAEENGGPIRLAITGPEGTVELLRDWLD